MLVVVGVVVRGGLQEERGGAAVGARQATDRVLAGRPEGPYSCATHEGGGEESVCVCVCVCGVGRRKKEQDESKNEESKSKQSKGKLAIAGSVCGLQRGDGTLKPAGGPGPKSHAQGEVGEGC